MRLRNLPLALTVILSSCALFQKPALRQEDTSIRFPNFREHFATTLGEQGKPYELDGATLRAITIAANDFIPPHGGEQQCWEKQEAHRYRVIRQGDIIFVMIGADPKACTPSVIPLDGGAKYAISLDGRILRRLFDGEPEGVNPAPESAKQEPQGTPIPDSQVGATPAETAPGLPSSWFDGGHPDAGSLVPDSGVQTPDAGSPGVPSPPDAG
ncbi:hypothetical protein ATI61_103289 [Archangium gephyra]|uniref:Lipoprotein n=1 Tax=Archangium gephyra TaxID=48 RepID=A0ABX9K6N2_9BACT|nr:hypothetical protein [Archangium gephyra]REG34395.1 hypothetical protein ATI61_103289 [Archangium gephyra]